MANAPRTGGIAALVAAATFVIGIVMFVTVMSDYATGDPSPSESVAFLVDNQVAFQIWNIIIYLCFGIALVPLTIAVHARLTADSPLITSIATAFGLIWAGLVIAAGMIANIGVGTVVDLADTEPSQAESVWSSLDAVQNGLGGGNEIVGGVWVLLVSWAAWAHGLPKALNALGVISGVAGVVTIAPALEDVGAVFGLGLIVWFTWLGVLLLREARGETEPDPQLARGPASGS
jgi:hypothetical protein